MLENIEKQDNKILLISEKEQQVFLPYTLKELEDYPEDSYYIYQIDELLKFHRYDLVTKYYKEDKYFEVWLDKNR